MNLYREILPADCPPEAAEEIVGPRIVYRLVDDNPPADTDFDSWRVKNPGAQLRAAAECQARGLSVYSRSRDVRRLIERSGATEARICQVLLDPGAGRIQKTGRRSHYTWWPWSDFDILPRCQVMP